MGSGRCLGKRLKFKGARGDGSALSLQLIAVGTRHCRLLAYRSGAAGIDITPDISVFPFRGRASKYEFPGWSLGTS